MRETVNLSTRQLLTVFRLCDPEESGRVKIERLQSLAKVYANGDTQVRIFRDCSIVEIIIKFRLECWCEIELNTVPVALVLKIEILTYVRV